MGQCCAPIHKECPRHHRHKGDPGVTPRTLWHLWCEGLSNRNVDEGPWCWKPLLSMETRVSHELCVAFGFQILECSRTPQLEVCARRYGKLSGALLRDNPWNNNRLETAPEVAKV